MRKSIDTYVQSIAHDNEQYINENNMTVADYIISNAENGTGYYEFFDDSELDGNEPSEEQIDELKDYLYNTFSYFQPCRSTASENLMEKAVKENGNIDLNELSWKQLVALLNAWNSDYARRENTSFSEMVKRCYKPRSWHENANIIYLHKDNMQTTIVPHACYNLNEGEEEMMLDLLKKQLK